MNVLDTSERLLRSAPDALFFFFPALLWLVYSLCYLFSEKKRGYRYFFLLLHTLLSSLFLLRFPVREALLVFSFSLFFSLCFSPLAKYERKKREKKKRQDPVKSFNEEFLKEELPPPPKETKPQKILVGGDNMASGDESYSLEKENVSLNHVLGVALQLKRANLNVADRLETDNIFRTLSLYRAKNNLNKEELASLNGYLSTLLKLMAKYSL